MKAEKRRGKICTRSWTAMNLNGGYKKMDFASSKKRWSRLRSKSPEITNLSTFTSGRETTESLYASEIYVIVAAIILFCAAQVQFLDYAAVKFGPIISSVTTAIFAVLVIFGATYKDAASLIGAIITAGVVVIANVVYLIYYSYARKSSFWRSAVVTLGSIALIAFAVHLMPIVYRVQKSVR